MLNSPISCASFAGSIGDASETPLSRKTVIVIACSILLLAGAAAALFSYSQVPQQPISFSHQLHAGDNKIPCQYCHTGARRSPTAGIPAVERCLGCHKIVAHDQPNIQKLKSYQEKNEPIPWVRVFRAPDFNFFNHAPHVRAGVECQTCHGPVETYDHFEEAPHLLMGWCLECHREKGAPVDCYTCHR